MSENDSDEEFIKNLLEKSINELETNQEDQLPIELIPTKSNPLNRGLDINDDYIFARESLRNSIQLMDKASREALIAIMESRHPKSVEAFAALMGQFTTASEKLMKLQTDMNKASGINNTPNIPSNPAFQIFSGSSSDLLDEVGDGLNPILVIDNGTKETSS